MPNCYQRMYTLSSGLIFHILIWLPQHTNLGVAVSGKAGGEQGNVIWRLCFTPRPHVRWIVPCYTEIGIFRSLIHWLLVPHICFGEQNQRSSCKGVRQAIACANADWLSIGPLRVVSMTFESQYATLCWSKYIWKCLLQKVRQFVLVRMSWLVPT